MICPNCGKEIEIRDGVGTLFVVGKDVQTGETFCEKCVDKRTSKIVEVIKKVRG